MTYSRDIKLLLPLAGVGLLVLTALLAPYVGSGDPYTQSLSNRFTPPFWLGGANPNYPLGADELGRSMLSRILFGARVSLLVATASVLLGAVVGTILGLVAGYFGGALDAIFMRTADSTLAFPIILLAIVLAVALGPSSSTVVIAVSILVWARYARMVRGEVLALKARAFVDLARVAGCSSIRVMARHLLPNVLNTVTVLATLQIGWAIIVEASLSFLGAGIPPPEPSWGSMVSTGRQYLEVAWWITAFPALAITVTVFSFNFLGDWLRDALDPRLKQT